MATIRKTSNNKFRVDIRKSQFNIKSKTFSTRKRAEAWGKELDNQIQRILNINLSKLKDISPIKIEAYGGMEGTVKLTITFQYM